MTFTDAAAEVLRQLGKPLHYKEITAYAIEKNLLSHVGKSPEVTMGARLAALFKKDNEDGTLVRVKPGVFALKEWEQSGQLKQMLARQKTRGAQAESSKERAESPEPPMEVPSPQTAAVPQTPAPIPVASTEEPLRQLASHQPSARPVRPDRRSERPPKPAAVAQQPQVPSPAVPSAEVAVPRMPEVTRTIAQEQAPIVARPPAPEPPPVARPEPVAVPTHVEEAAQGPDSEPESVEPGPASETAVGSGGMFEEEDDDDLPIFGGPEVGPDRESRRRRRRRRRKGGQDNNGSLPAYSVSPAFADASHDSAVQQEPRTSQPSAAGPVVLEVNSSALDSIALDDFGGRDMADAIAIVLGAFDRAAGPVSLRQIAEAAQRRARLGGDIQQVQSQIAAAVRADNMRRIANGQRPRFRFAGGRIALTDWLLSPDLARLEQEAINAVERYRDAARRAFARKVQELPGHAFVELALLALERIGFVYVRAVRRAGIPGNEAHFAAMHKTGGIDIPTALVIRRDGREIGRERVAELRGSLHHYGPAAAGWLITAGQVLSGAREEAGATQSSSIALLDGLNLARLCEKHDVAVIQANLPVAVPDVDLLEALRAS